MSVWTHVAGTIRYDDLRPVTGDKMLDRYKTALGNTCSFVDTDGAWDKCDVPCGSEGSLEWAIQENPSSSAVAAYAVNIWGDLRDFRNYDEIKKWFERCVLGDDFMVRQAVLMAQVEGQGSRVWFVVRDAAGKKAIVETKHE